MSVDIVRIQVLRQWLEQFFPTIVSIHDSIDHVVQTSKLQPGLRVNLLGEEVYHRDPGNQQKAVVTEAESLDAIPSDKSP